MAKWRKFAESDRMIYKPACGASLRRGPPPRLLLFAVAHRVRTSVLFRAPRSCVLLRSRRSDESTYLSPLACRAPI